jgi:hypothetical protein
LKHLLPADYISILAGLILFTTSLFFVYGSGTSSAIVAVKGAEASYLYPLEAASRVAVAGPLGETVVVLEAGGVRIERSPCKNQSCVAMGTIHRRGQWLACLPNAVLVTIDGAAEQKASRARQNTPDAGTW